MQENSHCFKKSYFISSQVFLQNCNDNNGNAYKNIVTITPTGKKNETNFL
jgi:hypothetical protein